MLLALLIPSFSAAEVIKIPLEQFQKHSQIHVSKSVHLNYRLN